MTTNDVNNRGNVLSDKAIRQLKDLPAVIDRQIKYLLNRQGQDPSAGNRLVRIAKTVSQDFDYPSGAVNKYEVKLGRPDFDNTTVGLETPSFTPIKSDTTDNKVRIACTPIARTIAEGTLVFIELHNHKWYILPEGVGSTNIIAFDTGGYTNEIPDQQCWFVSLSRVSNDEGPSEEPDEMIGFPEGTKLLYKGNSWDLMTGGNAYNTYLWVYQTCNNNVDMLEWMEQTYVSDWVAQLPENAGNPNDAWTQESANLLSCYRDAILNIRDSQLEQPATYEIDDLLGPLDADECDPDNLCANIPKSAYACDRRIRATVTHTYCGMSDPVPDEAEDGTVELRDSTCSFLWGRTDADLRNRKGIAVYMKESDEPYGECYWLITWMDMFDEVQMVSDIIIGSRGITIERKKVDIWRECDLPEEWIEGNTCEDS